jgi:hypothetical protein
VTITFWRPQRPAIPGTGEPRLVDLGGLDYRITVSGMGVTTLHSCPASAFSGLSGGLTPAPDATGTAVAHDGSADAPPDPARTLALTVDLQACLGADYAPGSPVMLDLAASDLNRSNALTQFWVRLPA